MLRTTGAAKIAEDISQTQVRAEGGALPTAGTPRWRGLRGWFARARAHRDGPGQAFPHRVECLPYHAQCIVLCQFRNLIGSMARGVNKLICATHGCREPR